MTLDEEEAERVFGGLRREFQLDLLEFKSKREFEKVLDKAITESKVSNLGRQGKSAIKIKGDDYFPTEWRHRHANALLRRREKQRAGIPVEPEKIRILRAEGRVKVLMRAKRWSDMDVETLRMLYIRTDEDKYTVAKVLHRSPSSVVTKASRLKIKRPKKVKYKHTPLEKV